MLTSALREQVARYLAYAGFGATVAISPWTNLDPVNIVKMMAIALFSFIAFGHIAPVIKSIWVKPYRLIIALSCAFIFWLFVAMAFNDAPVTQQIFGTFGRNTGLLSYFSLSLLFMVAAVIVGYRQGRKLALALLYAGGFNAIYGYFQTRGLDPIPWSNPFNSIIGTLGNPNFSAALLGMTTVVALAIGLGKGITLPIRILVMALAAVSFFLAYTTGSAQGPAIVLAGSSIVIYQFVVKTLNWRWARIPYILIVVFAAALSVLGTLQKGPLQSILYQDSVTYRGDYWRAGLAMTLESPLKGIGLDSYGDFYRTVRTLASTERRGPDIISNSAHNVFLDISASGGLPLVIIYLAIIGLAVRSSYRILSRVNQFDWVPVALVSAWFAYLLQSVISINQLGLAVWGWLLPGAIIGMDLNANLKETPIKDAKGRRVYAPAKHLLVGVALGIVAVMVSLWPLRYDAIFRYSLASADKDRIYREVKQFPMNNYHILYAANQMVQEKKYDQAFELYKLARENNPRDFYAWLGISSFSNVVGEERNQILAKLRELDPYNNTIPQANS